MAIIKNLKTGHEHNIGNDLLIELMTGRDKEDYEVIECSKEIEAKITVNNDEQDVHKKILGTFKQEEEIEQPEEKKSILTNLFKKD